MEKQFRASVTINKSPNEVFAYAASIERLPLWTTARQTQKVTPGPLQKGSVFIEVHSYRGKRLEIENITTEFVVAEQWGYKNNTGPYPFRVLYTFEPTTGGETLVTAFYAIDVTGIFRMSLLLHLVSEVTFQRQLQKNLEALKGLLEGIGDRV